MLELSDAKLELVQIVARNEVQVLDEAAEQRHRLLADPRAGTAHARGQLAE
jgi:predicted transcriptional regulator